jgi:hypothetical protein
MRALLIALSLLVLSAQAAYAVESVGQRWENSLLAYKPAGTLPGPRQGQRCLWSARLQCLWYTPRKWDLYMQH